MTDDVTDVMRARERELWHEMVANLTPETMTEWRRAWGSLSGELESRLAALIKRRADERRAR